MTLEELTKKAAKSVVRAVLSNAAEKVPKLVAYFMGEAYKLGLDDRVAMFADAIAQEHKRIQQLIAEEMVIAQKEEQPTSRLTSLANKISNPA